MEIFVDIDDFFILICQEELLENSLGSLIEKRILQDLSKREYKLGIEYRIEYRQHCRQWLIANNTGEIHYEVYIYKDIELAELVKECKERLDTGM